MLSNRDETVLSRMGRHYGKHVLESHLNTQISMWTSTKRGSATHSPSKPATVLPLPTVKKAEAAPSRSTNVRHTIHVAINAQPKHIKPQVQSMRLRNTNCQVAALSLTRSLLQPIRLAKQCPLQSQEKSADPFWVEVCR